MPNTPPGKIAFRAINQWFSWCCDGPESDFNCLLTIEISAGIFLLRPVELPHCKMVLSDKRSGPSLSLFLPRHMAASTNFCLIYLLQLHSAYCSKDSHFTENRKLNFKDTVYWG